MIGVADTLDDVEHLLRELGFPVVDGSEMETDAVQVHLNPRHAVDVGDLLDELTTFIGQIVEVLLRVVPQGKEELLRVAASHQAAANVDLSEIRASGNKDLGHRLFLFHHR